MECCCVHKREPDDLVVALVGNPNVGKSTVFNALTGLNQHTGNWPGKTVAIAQGRFTYKGRGYVLVDLPGTYSLLSQSEEERVAAEFILSGQADCTVVLGDATCLERNLNLVLQILELTDRVLLCVNGCGIIRFGQEEILFYKGDCIFVPADSALMTIHGQAQFLDVRG